MPDHVNDDVILLGNSNAHVGMVGPQELNKNGPLATCWNC